MCLSVRMCDSEAKASVGIYESKLIVRIMIVRLKVYETSTCMEAAGVKKVGRMK